MRIALATTALAFLVACGSAAPPDAPDATVADVPTETVDDAKPAPTGDAYAVDATQSKLMFTPSKVLGSHPTVIHKYTGTLNVAEGNVVSIAYTADMSSIESDNERLTTHLLDADFFDVAKFPESTFASTAISADTKIEGFTHSVTGDLSIMGKTKRITFPATITIADGKVSATSRFDLDRRDFGLIYKGKKDNLIQDMVQMEITLVASTQDS